ncbi:MAG: FAD:protein FMN transferase [Clostridia bacterium]|nr:FAD:protein FMN transferase [Clostridia bacterium]
MKKFLIPLFALCLVLSLTACQPAALLPQATAAPSEAPALGRYSGYILNTFDTAMTLIGFTDSQETFDKVLAQMESRFIQLHREFDKYNAYPGVNNLYTLNAQAAHGPVTVSKDMMDLLVQVKAWQEQFPNATNIAMGSVLALWHDARETAENDPLNAYIPSLEDLQAAAAHTSMANVVLDEEAMTVTFTDPLVQLDLGAVAKGYAAERVAQEILYPQMPSFILNAGGNVRAGNPPMDGRKAWGIGIQDPAESIFSANPSKDVLFFADTSLVTSGTYQRYFEMDGVRYHHLISPQTLFPADFCESLTIVTEDSFMADFLSTTCFMLPYEESRQLVDSLEGVEALWIFKDGTTQMTDGLKPMAQSQGAVNK